MKKRLTPLMEKDILYYKEKYPKAAWRTIAKWITDDLRKGKYGKTIDNYSEIGHQSIIDAYNRHNKVELGKKQNSTIHAFHDDVKAGNVDGNPIRSSRVYGDSDLWNKIKIELVNETDFLHLVSNVKLVKYMIAGCFQIPFHSKQALEIFYEFIEKYQPHLLFLNGDIIDLPSISRFVKNGYEQRELTISREFIILCDIINKINEISPDTKVIFRPVSSNHEERWVKKLAVDCKELFDLVYFEKVLFDIAYENNIPINLIISKRKVDYMGKVRIKHCGSLTKYGVEKNIENAEYHSFVNHSHRANHFTRVQKDTGTLLQSFEFGCMCKSNPDYIDEYKFVRAFGYGTYDCEKSILQGHLNVIEDYIIGE